MFRNILDRFNIFRATHPRAAVAGGIELFFLFYVAIFILFPSWQTTGRSQFINTFIFFTPITIWFFARDNVMANDPDTRERTNWVIVEYIVGFIFFGYLMYLGFVAQQFNGIK